MEKIPCPLLSSVMRLFEHKLQVFQINFLVFGEKFGISFAANEGFEQRPSVFACLNYQQDVTACFRVNLDLFSCAFLMISLSEHS